VTDRMRDASVIEIDLNAIAENMRLLRRIVGPDCAVCPVVKADGYGLGATRVASCLIDAGAEMLAVYTLTQAEEVLQGDPPVPVLVLMPVRHAGSSEALNRALLCGRLHLSVHDRGQLEDLVGIADRHGSILPVHLELDTGMSRGGCNLADAAEVLQRIIETPKLRLAGLYTHFASAETDEDSTDRQDDAFDRFLDAHQRLIPAHCLVHAANTCATLRDHSYHKSMIRIGQAWAGYGPESIVGGRVLGDADRLMPCLTWSSEIVQLKTIDPGVSVGYGSTWTARRRSLIGLVPIGYADGYPLALSSPNGSREPARVALVSESADGVTRYEAPVVGRVNMDQITIDLTGLRSADDSRAPVVRVGTPVELITPDRAASNHLPRLAALAGTNPYEILCRLNPRIRRVYHRASATVEVFTRSEATAAAAG
jgi:alanine racemase